MQALIHTAIHFFDETRWARTLSEASDALAAALVPLNSTMIAVALPAIATAGLAGLVGGAISMALGEYVSVSTQRDSERSLLAQERRHDTYDQ